MNCTESCELELNLNEREKILQTSKEKGVLELLWNEPK